MISNLYARAFARLALMAMLACLLGLHARGQASLPKSLEIAQGEADSALIDWTLAHSGPLKGDLHAANYRIAFSITPAEGWWEMVGNDALVWHEPPASSYHLRVFVAAANGVLLPGLTVNATLTDAHGNQLPAAIAYGWYPLANAYGGNVPLELSGELHLRVVLAVPVGARAEMTTVDFPPVTVAPEVLSHLPLATDIAPADAAVLLKPANAARSAAMTALWRQSVAGEERAAGDYFIAYALSAPVTVEGRLQHRLGLSHQGRVGDQQLTLLVRDSLTGRIIPFLDPQAALSAPNRKTITATALAFGSEGPLAVYRTGLRLEGLHHPAVRVRFAPPGFRRWGRQGQRFAAAGEIEFPAAGQQKETPKDAEKEVPKDGGH